MTAFRDAEIFNESTTARIGSPCSRRFSEIIRSIDSPSSTTSVRAAFPFYPVSLLFPRFPFACKAHAGQSHKDESDFSTLAF